MRRFIALFLCAAVFTACGEKSPAPAETSAVSLGDISGEIRVSAFDALLHKSYLETAAAMFEEKYPGTTVNVEVHSPMPEIKTMETGDGNMAVMMIGNEQADPSDYISKITTELMSGSGPDIMAADVLPYYNYAIEGQIENLKDYMSGFNINDYRGNLLEALEINGGLYIFPMDYNFEIIAYDPSLFTEAQLEILKGLKAMTYEEMLALVAEGYRGDEKVFSMNGGMDMFNKLLSVGYNEFVVENKTASFDDGRFAALLETAKAYEEQGYIAPGSARELGDITRMGDVETSYYKNTITATLMNYLSEYYSTAKTEGLRNKMVLNGVSLEDTDELMGLVENNAGDKPFSYNLAYAINSNSLNKATAWEFLKFLASEEVQTAVSASVNGIPINKKAANEKARLEAAGQGRIASATAPQGAMRRNPEETEQGEPRPEGAVPGEGEGQGEPRLERLTPGAAPVSADVELTEEQQRIYEIYLQIIDEYSDMLNVCFVRDSIVDSIINAEAAAYFAGSKTAEEAAEVIQNKAGLYLSE